MLAGPPISAKNRGGVLIQDCALYRANTVCAKQVDLFYSHLHDDDILLSLYLIRILLKNISSFMAPSCYCY